MAFRCCWGHSFLRGNANRRPHPGYDIMSLVLVKPSLQELRHLIGAVENQDRERSSFSLFPEGFARGSILELSGPGKTELTALFLREHPEFKVAWIEKELTINPYALLQKGVKTENILFIEAGKELSWCLTQALQSGCFQALITNTAFEEKDLRRYQLLAERSQAHFFLLSKEIHPSWVPNLQLKIQKKKQGLEIKTLRKRGMG